MHFEYVLHASLALNLKGHFFSLFSHSVKALAIVGENKAAAKWFYFKSFTYTQQQFPATPRSPKGVWGTRAL